MLSWPFPGWVGGSGGVDGCASVSRGRLGVRYVKAPARPSLAYWVHGLCRFCCNADAGFRVRSSPRHWKQAGTGPPRAPPRGGVLYAAVCPTKARLRGTSETSWVEGPWIFSRVSFPEMGKTSHEGDILQRGRESKHTVFRASVWAPFDQVSIYW